MNLTKGTTFRINMQIFRTWKWTSGSVGDFVGKYDGLSGRQEYLRENSASGNKCNGFRPGIVMLMTVRWRSGYLVIATGISLHGFRRSFAIRRMNANALPERCIRKDLRKNRSARYSRISMTNTTIRQLMDVGLPLRVCHSMILAIFEGV